MRSHLTSLLVASLLSTAACKSKKDDGPAPAPAPAAGKAVDPAAPAAAPTTPTPAPAAKAGGRAIPNSDGLTVEAPAEWLDNGVGGAAGLHLADDGGDFQLNVVSPEEAAKPFAQRKTDIEAMLFEKWISAEETADGHKLLYEMDKIKMDGDNPVKDGVIYAFDLRRKIGDKLYACTGSAATEANAKVALDLCGKVQH